MGKNKRAHKRLNKRYKRYKIHQEIKYKKKNYFVWLPNELIIRILTFSILESECAAEKNYTKEHAHDDDDDDCDHTIVTTSGKRHKFGNCELYKLSLLNKSFNSLIMANLRNKYDSFYHHKVLHMKIYLDSNPNKTNVLLDLDSEEECYEDIIPFNVETIHQIISFDVKTINRIISWLFEEDDN